MIDNNNMKNTYNGWGALPAADELQRCDAEGLQFGRIIRENRGQYQLAAPSAGFSSREQIMPAEVSGAFRYKAVVPADYPAVGDWVALRGNPAVIEWVFSRRSSFSRNAAGVKTEEQVIAANVDVVFLVFAINGGRNFTAAGLERYLTVAWNSGARPVVVLNKSDLCSEAEREASLLTAESAAPGVDIILVSAATGEGLEAFWVTAAGPGTPLGLGLKPGETIALAGPSGVGKSTLINALAGSGLQKTGAQREADLRGRHTTTHRELFRLPSGLLMIDSPGMREMQLWADSESADEAFSDIAEIAFGCRFVDCSHTGEPGCSVLKALEEGELGQRRYESYLELRSELEYLQRKKDESDGNNSKKRWKGISKEIKRYYKQKE